MIPDLIKTPRPEQSTEKAAEANSDGSLLSFANWPLPLYYGFVLLIVGVAAYLEWLKHELLLMWFWSPLILFGGWVLRHQGGADMLNKRNQCARCGCSLVGESVMTYGNRRFYSYCLRCAPVVKWVGFLVHGCWIMLFAAVMSFVAYQAGWVAFILTLIASATIGPTLFYLLTHGRPGIMTSQLRQSDDCFSSPTRNTISPRI